MQKQATGKPQPTYVIEVSTETFHLLQRQAPWLVEWAEQKSGPTQKILLPADLYNELIDRAIAHRQTLDQTLQPMLG